MTEQEFLTSTDPAMMLRFLTESSFGPVGLTREDAGIAIPSERKLRLFGVACIEPSGCAVYKAEGAIKVPLGELLRHMLNCHPEPRKAEVSAAKAALLRDIIGNPWKPVTLADPVDWMGFPPGPHFKLPRFWLTPPVLALARSAYDSQDFSALPILADALDEAGCTSVDLLMHLRGVERSGQPSLYGETHWRRLRGPHTRGCWALDLLLGKE